MSINTKEFWVDRVKRLIAEAKTVTPPPELQQKFNARLKGLQYMNRSRHVPNGLEVLVIQSVMDTFEEMLATIKAVKP